jgi:alpha-ribazole phosphatase
MKRLYLVRHGETVGSAGLAVGQTDLQLSRSGVREVEALAASWSGPAPDLLVASDLSRAALSAQILGARFGGFPTFDPRLRELSFGDWEGRPWDEIHREDPGRLAAWGERWWEVAPPGGETFADLKHRVLAWLEELARIEEGVVVAVAHGGSLRALLAALLDIPDPRAFELKVDYAHVSAFDLERERAQLLFLNRERFA